MKKLIMVPLLLIGLQGLAQTDTNEWKSYYPCQTNCAPDINNPFDYNSPEWWDYMFKDLQGGCYICENKKANNGNYVQGWAGGSAAYYEYYKKKLNINKTELCKN